MEKHYKGILIWAGCLPAEPQTTPKGRIRHGNLSLPVEANGALGSGVSGAMAQLSHLLPPQEVPDAHGWGKEGLAPTISGDPSAPRRGCHLSEFAQGECGAGTPTGLMCGLRRESQPLWSSGSL